MNPRWLNAVATVIVGVLLVLSGTLVIGTLSSGLNSAQTALWLAAALILAAAADRQGSPDRPGMTPPEPPPRAPEASLRPRFHLCNICR